MVKVEIPHYLIPPPEEFHLLPGLMAREAITFLCRRLETARAKGRISQRFCMECMTALAHLDHAAELLDRRQTAHEAAAKAGVN